jgi:hypothetical protein
MQLCSSPAANLFPAVVMLVFYASTGGSADSCEVANVFRTFSIISC